MLAGAAGLKLGVALSRPGRLTRKQALVAAGRAAAGIMYGAAAMLFAAAFVEAFWSPRTTVAPEIKYGVGIAAWVLRASPISRSRGATVQLDRLALHLRRRSPMEAIDLGCAMARTWWRPVLAAWLPLYLGATVLAAPRVLRQRRRRDPRAVVAEAALRPRRARRARARGVRRASRRARRAEARCANRRGCSRASRSTASISRARSTCRYGISSACSGRAASRRARALHGRSRALRGVGDDRLPAFRASSIMLVAVGRDRSLHARAVRRRVRAEGTARSATRRCGSSGSMRRFYALTVTLHRAVLRRRRLRALSEPPHAARSVGRRARAAALRAARARAARRGARRDADARWRSSGARAAAGCGARRPKARRRSGARRSGRSSRNPSSTSTQDVKRLRYTGPGWGSEPPRAARSAAARRCGSRPLRRSSRALLMWIARRRAASLSRCTTCGAATRALARRGRRRAARRRRRSSVSRSRPSRCRADVAAAALAAIDAGNVRGGLSLLYRGALSVLVHSDGARSRGRRYRRRLRAARRGAGRRRQGAAFSRELVAAWQSDGVRGTAPGATSAARALPRVARRTSARRRA